MKVTSRVRIGIALVGLALTGFPLWNVSLAQTASPYTTGYLYNLDGQVTGVVQPCTSMGCLATRNTYTSGLLSEVDEGTLASWPGNTAPSQWSGFAISRIVTYTYDPMGHVTSKEVLSGANVPYDLTQYSYDNMERVKCEAVNMNPPGLMSDPCSPRPTPGAYGYDRVTYTIYDPQNHPLTIYRAYGTSNQEAYATYTYSPNGLEKTVEDANKNLTTLYYDGLDRLWETEFPSKTTAAGTSDSTDVEQYTYDNNDNRLTLVTRDGQTIQYIPDALNRVKEKIAPGEQNVYYGYNLQDQRLYANFSSTTGQGVSDVYDGFGEMTSETVNLSGTALAMAYQYDSDGDRTEVAYPDGAYIQYTYDGLDRLQNVLQSGATNLATYSYDGDGRLEELSRAGGLAWTTYGYDGISRLNSLEHIFSSSANDVTYSIPQYNPDDQITSETISNSAYYPLAAGATTSYSPNGLNQYSTVGGAAFSYDARGNLTADASNTYSYDVENHLAGSTLNSASLTYDPLGRLYEVSSTSGTTTFLYDGDRITAEYNGSGTLTNRYAYGVDGDDPIVWYQGSSIASPQYLFADHEGSIVAVTGPSGSVVATDQYDSYGQGGASSQNQGRFQFTGQAYIPELNEYYYKARMYNPSVGRFMQTDPIGYTDDLDLYAYVGNDPMDRTDPSGDDAVGAGAAVGCAVGAETGCAPGAAIGAVVGGIIDIGGAIIVAYEGNKVLNQLHNESAPSDTPKSPGVPDKLIGAGQSKSTGKRVNSGPLAPEHGGTGDDEQDFDKLTGGNHGSAPSDKGYPEGTRVGGNGISHRPAAGGKGPRIDIPGNGSKPPETLHYPTPQQVIEGGGPCSKPSGCN